MPKQKHEIFIQSHTRYVNVGSKYWIHWTRRTKWHLVKH